MTKSKVNRRVKIRYRIRNKIKGTPNRPRLSVYRSNKAIYCQLIDDINGITLASASSQDKSLSGEGAKKAQSREVGKLIAERAKACGITAVVFDRAGYLYHGRVKELADGAREGGLQF
jgi:large subunit ribosomal protein L18